MAKAPSKRSSAMRRCRTEKRRSPYGHGPEGSEIKRPSVWPSTTFHCIMNRRTVDAIGGIDVSTQPTDLPVVPICRGPRLLISTPNQWLHSNRPTPQRGVSRSSRTRGGMRWTRQRLAREGIAGRVERLVSDQQRADERCCGVRRSRVVLTPRRWRQVRGV